MSSRRIGAALMVVLAISAAVASSAYATATTEARKWFTGATEGSTTELTAAQKVTASIGVNPEIGSKFLVKSEIGSPSIPIEKTSTGIECVGCQIENKEVTSKAGKVAFGTGKVKLTGVTMMTPSTCGVADEGGVPGQWLSKAVNIHADLMQGTKHYVQFIPVSGEVFVTFELTGEKCPISGLYSIKGTLFAEFKNVTGACSKEQPVIFSPAINEAGGGSLQIGSKKATITGTAIIKTEGEKFFCVK